MNCEKWDSEIALHVEEDLPRSRTRRLEEHLRSCPACRSFRNELVDTQALFKGLRDDAVGDDSLTLVRDRVMTTVRTDSGTGVLPWVAWTPKWTYALAGVAAMVVVSLVLWGLRGESPLSEVPLELAAIPTPVEPEVSPTPPDPAPVDSTSPPGEMESTEATVPVIAAAAPPEPTPTGPDTQVRPEVSNAEAQLVVKLLTDDPNIVIYWIIDQDGGQE